MVNNDRIVPITNIDFLSMIGTVLTLNGTNFTVAQAQTVEGDFTISPAEGQRNFLVNQPVKTINVATSEAANIYFVAAYGYAGFSINGTAVTTTGDTVQPDGITLYKAVSAGNAVTITAVTPQVAAS